jgi:hypothetical protein
MPDLIGEEALKWLREVCPPFRIEPEPEQDDECSPQHTEGE